MTNEQNKRGHVRRDRFGIAQMLILVTGIAIAFWVMRPLLLQEYDGADGDPIQMVPVFLRVVIVILGGISLVGVPLLLFRRRRDRTRWGPGKMAWFSHGTASWLLWPPILFWQLSGKSDWPWSAVCWLWGTPLMGIYVTASLLTGGWLRRRGRRGLRRDWSERFGLLVACGWACTGLYLLYLLSSIDLFRKE
ncbi:MAG: hypothetical protein QGF59_06490 [Pirellulaceae bacterium]|nr:hypothetical protein [Pirellulaceae bacterium]